MVKLWEMGCSAGGRCVGQLVGDGLVSWWEMGWSAIGRRGITASPYHSGLHNLFQWLLNFVPGLIWSASLHD